MQVLVRPAAAADIEEAFLWYEQQRSGLGADFLRTVDGALAAIQSNPQLHTLIQHSSKHTKGFASAIPVRHLLPHLSRFNCHRCVHARPARPQALAVARLMANHVVEYDARQDRASERKRRLEEIMSFATETINS